MCDILLTWIEDHPAMAVPPPRERRQLSIYLTPEEHENLSRLVNDSRLYGLFQGKHYQVVRHALNFYMPTLLELLDEGYRPLSELMRAEIARTGLGQTLNQINDFFSIRGRELIMLLDSGEGGTEAAFTHYEQHVLTFTHARDGVWRGIMVRLMFDHPDIAVFRERVRRQGVLEEQRLRAVEEVLD